MLILVSLVELRNDLTFTFIYALRELEEGNLVKDFGEAKACKLATNLALEHNIVSKNTSFLCIDERSGLEMERPTKYISNRDSEDIHCFCGGGGASGGIFTRMAGFVIQKIGAVAKSNSVQVNTVVFYVCTLINNIAENRDKIIQGDDSIRPIGDTCSLIYPKLLFHSYFPRSCC